MTLSIGRVTLPVLERRGVQQGKNASDFYGPTGQGRSADGSISSEAWSLSGVAVGDDAEDLMTALKKEGKRRGDVWVTESNDLVPAGYYKLVSANHDTGDPGARRWRAELRQQSEPTAWRQAEDDNVAGVDTADRTAEEELHVAVSMDTATLLDPRNVSGAEPLNLPMGTWRVHARVYAYAAVVPGSPVLGTVGVTLTDVPGATIAATQTADVEVFNEWTEIHVGDFLIPAAYDSLNWYKAGVTVGDADILRVDRVRFTRIP